MQAVCTICFQQISADKEPPDQDQIPICVDCYNEHPLLVSGVVYDKNITNKRVENKKWYSWLSLEPTSITLTKNPEGGVKEHIQDAVATVERVGTKPALTFFTLHHLAGQLEYEAPHTGQRDIGLPPAMTKFALCSIASVNSQTEQGNNIFHDIDSTAAWRQSTDQFNELCPFQEELYGLIDCYRNVLASSELVPEELKKETDPSSEEWQVAEAARSRELITGRFATPEQYIQTMRNIYSPFQNELLKSEGIDIVNGANWAEEMLHIFADRIEDVFQQLAWFQADSFRAIGGYASYKKENKEHSWEDYVESKLYQELHNSRLFSFIRLASTAETRLWISRRELKTLVSPYKERRFNTFLDRISQSIGDYSTPSLFEYNEMDKHPLIEHKNKFLVPIPMFFGYALSKTFKYDLMEIFSDGKYNFNRDHGNVRGEALEIWAASFFRRMFSDADVYRGIEFETDSESDIDVLCCEDDKYAVVEVKSKALSENSWSGEWEDLVKDMVEKGVGEAADQADTDINMIRDGVSLDMKNKIPSSADLVPIVVMGATYDQLGTKEFDKLISNSIRTPYVLSIYDLDVISQLLTGREFIEYAEERIRLTKRDQLESSDELDYLANYLGNSFNYQLSKIDMMKEISESDDMHVVQDTGDYRQKIESLISSPINEKSITWVL
ncbi:MAG: hypothetical protein ABEI13_01795 [Candidatus Paceibacteria bacterium]